MLAGLAVAVIIAAVAAQFLYFSPMEKKYVVGGPEVLFGQPTQPADNGLAAIKEKLLKHPLYLNLQKFGVWPIDLPSEKASPGSPFIE